VPTINCFVNKKKRQFAERHFTKTAIESQDKVVVGGRYKNQSEVLISIDT